MKTIVKTASKSELGEELKISRSALDRFLNMPGAPTRGRDKSYNIQDVRFFIGARSSRHAARLSREFFVVMSENFHCALGARELAAKLEDRVELLSEYCVGQSSARIAVLLRREIKGAMNAMWRNR